MSGFFENLSLGCQVAFSAANLLYCFIGVFIGTLIGVLPGLGPVATISMLLPVTFGIVNLEDGLGLVPVVIGLFGVGEVLVNLQESLTVEVFKAKIKGLLPNVKDWMESIGPIIRGSFLGFFLGILPGGGAIMSTFVSYAMEKKLYRILFPLLLLLCNIKETSHTIYHSSQQMSYLLLPVIPEP